MGFETVRSRTFTPLARTSSTATVNRFCASFQLVRSENMEGILCDRPEERQRELWKQKSGESERSARAQNIPTRWRRDRLKENESYLEKRVVSMPLEHIV